MENFELSVDDISVEEWTAVVFTQKVDFAGASYGCLCLSIFWNQICNLSLKMKFLLSGGRFDQLNRLVDALENDEDVDKVWTNVK